MFKRAERRRAGNAAYDAYKTRAIAHAEQRRIKPGAQANFCRTADIVFAAALAPDKPVLEDFVSGVPVNEANPVDSCEIKVAVTLQGVQAGPDIAPTPRPALAGRSAESEPVSAIARRGYYFRTAPSSLIEIACLARTEVQPGRREFVGQNRPRAQHIGRMQTATGDQVVGP